MFSSLVLLIWPVLVLISFSQYPVHVATLFSIIAGYLLLPEIVNFELPLLPTLHKDSIPAVAAALFLLFSNRLNTSHPHNTGLMLRSIFGNVFLFLALTSPFLTVITNPDPLVYGPVYLPGLRPYDGFSAVLAAMMRLLPLIVAFKYLAHPEHHKAVVIALIISGLAYSLPTLFEVAFSPKLHLTIYGFFQHSWPQHFRANGYRPIVFLGHGLEVSLFLALSTLSALGASRWIGSKYRLKVLFSAGFLFCALIATKSLGALLLAILLGPVVLILSVRLQFWIAGAVAMCVLVYPAARAFDAVPTDRILTIFESINPDRAHSLSIRFENEDILLERAQERPTFGWGGYGRNRVINSYGRDVSITDGYWVIVFGVGGWSLYLAEMGLLTLPLMILAFRARRVRYGPETAVLAVVAACNLADLVPNAGITPVTWLITGALWGRLAMGHVKSANSIIVGAKTDALPNSKTQYARSYGLNPNQTPTYARQFKPKADK